MIDPFGQREIWFLTGSQDLYGEAILARVEAQSRTVVETLNAAPEIPVRISWRPVLTDRDRIRHCLTDANADDACIGIITWMHTFSPAKAWIAGLGALRKPLLHLHTQSNEALPWADLDMDFMNLNQSAHGDREFAYLATRLSIARKTVVGHATHQDVQVKIGRWARAAAGVAAARGLKIARFGDNMRDVAVTEGDKTEAEYRLGISTNTWGVTDLAARMGAVADQEIDKLTAEYDDIYAVAPELSPTGNRRDSLRYAARMEIGMRGFLAEGSFGAFTTNFQDLGPLRQLPGLAVQRLMADGYGFGAEGDWKTAALVRIAKVMGHGLPGGASLMEDYTYELTPGREAILGAHMLEVCPSLTTATPRLEIHPLSIGDREDPVRLVFDADPGPAVVVAMSDMRDRFRLTANVVDIVPPDAQLPRLPVARAVWRPAPSLAISAECWLTAGGAHHTVLTSQIDLESFEDFATAMGIELAAIDAHTTPHAFGRELRWNQAYYRMAQYL